MTKEEAVRVLAILKAAYPNSYNGITKEEATGTVTVWALQFAEISVDVVLMAVQKCISSNKFPPAISEVKAKIGNIAWEAYEKLSREIGDVELTESERTTYQRIYNETQAYKYCKFAEPSLQQMICSGNKPLLAERNTPK